MLLLLSAPVYAQDDSGRTGSSVQEADAAGENSFDFMLRLGMGGFRDSRSSSGDVGGDQLALDIKPVKLPLVLSISSEYYTSSADPAHSYEIESLVVLNLLYTDQLPGLENIRYFVGGGIGSLKVPKSEAEPGVKVDDTLVNLEAGIHVKPFRRIGFYGAAKYLSAQKNVDGIKVIDFSESIFLLGVTYSFSL